MSRFKNYTCTIEVSVTDRARLIELAQDKAQSSGCARNVIKNAADAIQWLLDDSGVFDGAAEIYHSACEAQ